MKNVQPSKVKNIITGVNTLDENNSKFGQLVSMMLNEEAANAIIDGEDDENEPNDGKEVKDTTPATTDTGKDGANQDDSTPGKEGNDKTGDEPASNENPAGENVDTNENLTDNEEEWASLDKYKIGDGNEYDFTNASDEDVVKVFKLIKGTDKVNVVKTDDGKINLKDNEEGVEYVIELGDDITTSENNTKETMKNEPIFEISFGECGMGECGMGETTDLTNDSMLTDDVECHCHNGKCTCHNTPGEDLQFELELNQEDNNEPQFDFEFTPDGNADEGLGEGSSISYANKRRMNKKNVPNTDNPYGQHLTNENKERLEKIFNENNELKALMGELKQALDESILRETNLMNINRLMVENSTTKDEKENIMTRFTNEAKTVEDSNKIYEQISSQLKANTRLNESKIASAPVAPAAPTPKSVVNETKVYESQELMESLSLMDRMNRLML